MDKACPIVLRHIEEQSEILVFRHPLAGIQIVKGSIEAGESSMEASERELMEEAGIALKAKYELREWQRYPNEPVWGICVMDSGDHLPDRWTHFCEDDGGHLLEFFWFPLCEEPDHSWDEVFVDAFAAIKSAFNTSST